MGSGRTRSIEPDLFSTELDQKSTGSNAPSVVRHVLPTDLPNAIKQLDDQELDRLLAAILSEQKRRGVKIRASIEPSKEHVKGGGVPLTTGKLNAVRAAFGAGIKPTQIARQFGLSDADVRKALASPHKKR